MIRKTTGLFKKVALTGVAGILGLAMPLAAGASTASEFPTGPVTITLPFPPGGATDLMARVVGHRLSQTWGQPVIVDNKPGAGTLIGSEAVARAKPDGYTLLLNVTSLVQAPHLRASSTQFDPVTALAPITEAAGTALILVANPSVPANTPAELVELVKANPGKYSYGSYGAGSSGHLYGHIFNEQTGLDMVHVAYRGEAPSVTDLIGGQIPLLILSGVGAAPNIQSGKMKALAVTSPQRSPILPDVPTFGELGYKGLSDSGWFGFFAPAGTPPEVVAKISTDINAILAEPEVQERLAPSGLVMKGSTPEEFAKVVKRDSDKWGAVIRQAGVSVD